MQDVTELLETIVATIKNDKNAKFYIHCRGGIGRTGTIVGCYYAMLLKSFTLANNLLQKQFAESPKSVYRRTPETLEQSQFIMRYADNVASAR
jgi:protein-tyrosine phosphatase